jgi:hypothetical protein
MEVLLQKQASVLSWFVAVAFLVPSALQAAQATALDTQRIEALTGLKGSLNADGSVFKVSFPRSDIRAKVGQVRMNPALGLTAWAAFTRMGDHAMVMGDIVVLENEISPIMSAALDSGLEVTALHNHFVWDEPKVMFMHIGGSGDEAELANAVGKVFARLKALIRNPQTAPGARIDPAETSLDTRRIASIIGEEGSMRDGVFKITIGRQIEMMGHRVGKDMGVNTWAAFAGTDRSAVVAGDFAVLEEELQDVLKTLRRGGIHVVAIHNHMTFEKPRMLFLHYWGLGFAEQLARTLRSALDTQGRNR